MWHLRRRSELHAERAYDLARATGSNRDLGAAYHALAYVHYISRRFTVSYSRASAAADCYRRSGNAGMTGIHGVSWNTKQVTDRIHALTYKKPSGRHLYLCGNDNHAIYADKAKEV